MLESPMAESARTITKPQVDLVTEAEMELWEAMQPAATSPKGARRLIATARHYRQQARDAEALLSLARSQILALQTELGEARAKVVEAQQMLGGEK